jgi:protein-L-isoaspartate(D-aspartate) O-methyltransferase
MDFRLRQQKMVDRLAEAGVRDPVVLRAFLDVPRHLFVEEALREKAYGVHSLPIGFQQTISQPEIAARMTEMLQILPSDRVLEVGTGSGYQAAILARLASEVFTLERIPQLARRAQTVLLSLGIGNVRIKVCDGSLGLGKGERFEVILVAAAAPEIPRPLLEHLSDGGRMVIPVGSGARQRLVRILRQGDQFPSEDRGPCSFVKLVGRSRRSEIPSRVSEVP